MAIFFNEPIHEDKVNCVQSTVDGSRSFTSPATGPTLQKLIHPKCQGCALKDYHNVTVGVSYDLDDAQHRYYGFPTNVRFLPSELDKIQAALWYLWFYPFGFYPENELIGLNTDENNPTESVQYRIVSASGTTLTLFGPNPKKILKSLRVANPEYIPGGEEPKFNTQPYYFTLPVGSQVQFMWPSVLENKCRPMITQINYPVSNDDDVEFSVVTTHSDMGNYDTPNDPDIIREDWDCRILFELEGESNWFNFRAFTERVFTRRSLTIATFTQFPLLKDFSDSSNAYILPPFSIPNAISVTFKRTENPDLVVDNWIAATTVLIDETPTTWLNFTGYNFPDLDEIVIDYWVADTDAGHPTKIRFQGTCSNDQWDPTINARRCMSPNCSGFANYTSGGCWQPNASGWCMGSEVDGWKIDRLGLRISDLDSSWFSDWWNRQNYFLKRVAPLSSPRAFRLLKNKTKDGPSIGNLTGGYTTQAPFIKSDLEYEDKQGAYGQRIVDGGVQYFVPGGQVRGPYEPAENLEDWEWYDANADPAPGSIPNAIGVSNFRTPNLWGNLKPPILQLLPPRNVGGASVAKHGTSEAHTMHATDLIMANADAALPHNNMGEVSQPQDVETLVVNNSQEGTLDNLDVRGDSIFS